MKKFALFVTLIAIAFSAIFLSLERETDVTIVNARAVAIEGQPENFMLTFEVKNTGPAKILSSIKSPSANMVHVMNPDYDDATIVIPAASNGIFAMDGAHVMVMGVKDSFEPGASIPITLTFEAYGDVTTRARNVTGEMGAMNHDMLQGIQSDPSPAITLEVIDGFSRDGASLNVSTENFTFVHVEDDAPHVPMEGHAHIYLNGLKLGRLYESGFLLGAMPSGTYELMVSLNSNTHQPYMQGGAPIHDEISFQLD